MYGVNPKFTKYKGLERFLGKDMTDHCNIIIKTQEIKTKLRAVKYYTVRLTSMGFLPRNSVTLMQYSNN